MARTSGKDSGRRCKEASQKVQGDLLRQAISWVFCDEIFANVKLHGNTKWIPRHLLGLVVLMMWSNGEQLTTAFKTARKLAQRLFSVVAVNTFQGLMRALVTWTPTFLPVVWTRLQGLMEQVGGDYYRIGKWLPLAVDGSRFTTPRTLSNERAFSAQKFGHGKRAKSRKKWKNKKKRSKKLCEKVKPQIWLTLIWHMGLKLPWCWQTGPSTSSERHHFIDLVKMCLFPKNTLFCADAGFVGYELWKAIIDQGHHFLIRVGANVRLLKGLGVAMKSEQGIVCLWPNSAARRHQPPIVLRLIEIKNERGSMFLVTNVLSEKSLSSPQLKRLYPLRWGIELQFRTTKQTFGCGLLRCRKAEHALAELNWSLIALTLVQLFALREQLQIDLTPDDTSVAQALKIIREIMSDWHEPVLNSEDDPVLRLQGATKDNYQRSSKKTARYRRNYKDKPGATKPVIQQASSAQRKAFQQLQQVI
jgi:hypothetical protein